MEIFTFLSKLRFCANCKSRNFNPSIGSFILIIFTAVCLSIYVPAYSQGDQSFRSYLYLLNPDNSTTVADGNLAQYNNSYSTAVDYMDARKFSNINESLGLLRNNVLLAIERRPIIKANDTLFLNLTKTTARSYQLRFDATTFNNPLVIAFLEDKYNGDSVMLNLSGVTTFNFDISNGEPTSQDPNRFMIVFKQSAQAGNLPVTFSGIKALQQNNNVSVNWNVESEINIKSYEVEKSTDGVTFVKIATVKAAGVSSDQYNWLDANAINGENYYRIRSVGNDGAIQYSHVVKIKIGIDNSTITLHANPVTNGIVLLQFTNMPKGIYAIRMVSSFGQVISTTTINYNGGSSIETVSFNRNISRGMYEVEIVKPGNLITTFKVQKQ